MKKVLLLSILIILVGVGCSTIKPQNSQPEKVEELNVSFEKKQECASYRKNILEELNDDSAYSKRLDEIFYSPSRDSCLYSYKSIPLIENGIKNLGIDYLIMDYFTNETVVYSNTYQTDTAVEYYEERKEELKK